MKFSVINQAAAVAVMLLSTATAGATSIKIDANGTIQNAVDSFNGVVDGFNVSVSSLSFQDPQLAFLSTTVIGFSASAAGTLVVELTDDYTISAGLTRFETEASVSQPATGSVDVAHYVSFDGGVTETMLSLFAFGNSQGAFSDIDNLVSDGTFRLRSLYTIVTTQARDQVNVNGDISATIVPVPAAGFLLLGGLGGLAFMKRRKKT